VFTCWFVLRGQVYLIKNKPVNENHCRLQAIEMDGHHFFVLLIVFWKSMMGVRGRA
jgi:hypothetical protein